MAGSSVVLSKTGPLRSPSSLGPAGFAGFVCVLELSGGFGWGGVEKRFSLLTAGYLPRVPNTRPLTWTHSRLAQRIASGASDEKPKAGPDPSETNPPRSGGGGGC